MRHNIEKNIENTAPTPPFEQPFKRKMPYADYLLLNDTQEIALPEFYRKRKIYYVGIALSGSLIGFTVGFFTSDFSSSTAQFMTGVATSANLITFVLLRRKYRREENILRLIIQLRYENKLMRNQDKEELCKFAKTVKMPEHVQELIKSGEYLPYDETEVADHNEANNTRTHEFTKKQYRHLLYSLLTTNIGLECYIMFWVSLMLLILVSGHQKVLYIQLIFGLLTAVFGGFSIWIVEHSRKAALKSCANGTVGEMMVGLKTAKPYTFFKVGEHLMYIAISGICLLGFLSNSLNQSPIKQLFIGIAAMITLLLTMFVIYRSIQSANRNNAANHQK